LGDEYYFIRGDQLYNITILHTADKEDWDLYNLFLDSFSFEGSDPYLGWGSYLSAAYGFAFRYPSAWALEERSPEEGVGGIMFSQSFLLTKESYRLIIQYKSSAEDYGLGHPGMPAGEVEDRGTVSFLERDLPKHVLVFEGKDKAVFMGDRFEDLEFYIWLDEDPGPGSGKGYADLELPAELQAEVEQILASFERVTNQ
jgi:hypothetical protein